MSKQTDIIHSTWNVGDRKKLVWLKDVTNIIFTKAKNNPGLGVPQHKISNIIIDEIAKKTHSINYSSSKRTINLYLTEVKVSSMLDGGFSITKMGIKKICIDIFQKIHCTMYWIIL